MRKMLWLAQGKFVIKLSSEGTRCHHDNTGLEENRKKSATCSFISSCHLGTSGLSTEAINILKNLKCPRWSDKSNPLPENI